MKKIITLLSLFISFIGYSQKKSAPLPDGMIKCWAASYEENKENSQEKLYRTCDHAFPPSRFRQSIEFSKNGTCKVLQVGETDAHYIVDCKYTYDKKKKVLDISDVNGKVKMKIKVISITSETLKIVFVD
ncbi:MAG: hypothetical protein H0W61_01955 [Bacteroidetes bacterium]|nr:hypothetical protein [Bacteroidota bacterium]